MADGIAIAFGPLGRPADHAAHDLVLVAEAADRGGRLPAAQASCLDCLALHADLVLLAAAMPDAALPARPRDYTLSEADAARLRPAGWRRWLAAIGTSRDAVTRPLAVGLTTIGLAGLLVASIPGILPVGGATSGAAPVDQEMAPLAGATGSVSASGDPAGVSNPVAKARDTATADTRMTPMLLVSGTMIVAGSGLLLVRWRSAPAAGDR